MIGKNGGDSRSWGERAFAGLLRFISVPLGIAGGLLFLAALGVWVWRVFVYLHDDLWFGSLCEVTTAINGYGAISIGSACAVGQTGWLGIDKVLNWFTFTADASLVVFLCGLPPFFVSVVLIVLAETLE